PNREFHLSLHVLEHVRKGRAPRYTVSVWDGTLDPPGLRALCHVRPLGGAMLAIARELAPSDQTETETKAFQCPDWSLVADLVKRLRSRKDDPDSETAAEEIDDLFARLHNTTTDLECAMDRLTRLGSLV